MEKKGNFVVASKTCSFLDLLKQAQSGDNEALEILLDLFETDIQRLASFIKLPHEDAVQAIKTELIEMLRSRGDMLIR